MNFELKYRLQLILSWVFGIGFAIAIVISNVAAMQRDEAREYRTALGKDELVCRLVERRQ